MITDKEAARKLAQKVIDSGHKGFLIVVFPEDQPKPMPEEVSFATNANNDVILDVIETVYHMLRRGHYKQEILEGGPPRLNDY